MDGKAKPQVSALLRTLVGAPNRTGIERGEIQLWIVYYSCWRPRRVPAARRAARPNPLRAAGSRAARRYWQTMTPDEIARLAQQGESETVEFKATTGQRHEAAKTLSAMLNGQGGRVIFGDVGALGGTFPTLGCRLVAVDGTELAEEFRDDALFEANISASLRRAMAFCGEHLHHRVRIGGDLHAEVGTEIPLAVMREALANAFGHRDYAIAGMIQVRIFTDRLEVHSPGQLHFGLKPADLYADHSSHPWNPNILGCMFRNGTVEQLGSGTVRMVRMCADAGLGRPAFTATSASVTCSVPRRGHWLAPGGAGVALSGLEASVLTALAGSPTTRRQLADDLEVSIAELRVALRQLRDLGLIRVEGHGRGAHWVLDNR